MVGLGYVGLPVALALARHFRVVGFDHSAAHVAALRAGVDPGGELGPEAFEGADIVFADDAAALSEARFHVVAVPTPVDGHLNPDLHLLQAATRAVGQHLRAGDVVVYESTVYPGCTEEVCVPLLEQVSGLRYPAELRVGYSPERINPGDRQHTLATVIKVVAGSDAATLDLVAQVYATVVPAGVHRVSSLRVAEAAKVIENTQRDLNIALMNELSIVFDRMGINTHEVLTAAGTKWNFLPFTPGLVGGHCVGVDPYYLTYKSQALGYVPKVILSGRQINDGMAAWVARQTVRRLVRLGKNLGQSRVLVLGLTFKENVRDLRNSKVVDLIRELRDFGLQVDVTDPHADPAEALRQHQLRLTSPTPPYDAVVLAVDHRDFAHLDEDALLTWAPPPAVVIDLKGRLRGQISRLDYWSL